MQETHSALIDAASVAAMKYGNAAAIGGGMWAWLGANSQPIGALCAVIGATMAVSGFITRWVRSRQCAKCGAAQ